MLSKTDLINTIKIIVEQQEIIIGPLAIIQANKVHGVKIINTNNIAVEDSELNMNNILTDLVNKYEELFGQASVEACREAIKEHQSTIPVKELPQILQ